MLLLLPTRDNSHISIKGKVYYLCPYVDIFFQLPQLLILSFPLIKWMPLRHNTGVCRPCETFVFSRWHSFRSSFTTSSMTVVTTELWVPQEVWASSVYLWNPTMYSEHLIKVYGLNQGTSLSQSLLYRSMGSLGSSNSSRTVMRMFVLM